MPPPAHWRELYPFQSREISLGGLRYHYLDEGSGAPLLFVHGNPTWSFFWRRLIGDFRTKYRCLAPDHIGMGLSDKPADYRYALAAHIDNLRRLIGELDLRRITLFAHDWGGAIGLGAAAAAPERFSRLVLFNSAAFRSQRIPWRISLCRTPLLGRLGILGLNLFARAALRMAVARGPLTSAVREGLLAPYQSWGERIGILRFVQDIPLRPSHASYERLHEVEQGLARLSHLPCALIWGMQDWCFTPHFLGRYLTYFPQARVHELAGAGHYVLEDAYEEVLPLVESFLADHPLPVAP